MNTNNKLTVLKKIAHEFNKADITWALGASLLLYFKRIAPDFHDIDIMVTNEDAASAKDILMRLGSLQPPNPNEKYQTKLFLEFVIDDVDVDMMAGFAIVHQDSVFDCSLQKDEIVEFYDLQGEQIPLQSLERWCLYYELMGRDEKVRTIKASLPQTAFHSV